jgi:hypothetical protein
VNSKPKSTAAGEGARATQNPAISMALNGAAEGVAEKVDFAASAPKGASDFKRLKVSLKRYPDTKPEFFRQL